MNTRLIKLFDEIYKDKGDLATTEVDDYKQILDRLYELQVKAHDKIVDRMGTEGFMKMMGAIQSIIMERLAVQDKGEWLSQDMLTNNDLETYTHYLTFIILGIAMSEEII